MAIEIAAKKRETSGSAMARRLRRAGNLPGVIYNSKGQSTMIELAKHGFEQMLHHHATENLIVDVTIDGQVLGKALLKEVQHDPVSGHVIHVDLVEISMTRKLRVNIPVAPVGNAPGVEAGGTLEQVLRSIEVEVLPGDLVEEFKVDVSKLNIGDSLLVRDLQLGDKFTILTNGSLAVVAVAQPRLEEEVAATATAAEGAKEPEVIARKAGEEAAEGAEAAPGKGGAAPAKGAAAAAKPAKGGK